MSKQEARKITIIEELLAGRLSNKQAAAGMSLQLTAGSSGSPGTWRQGR
jgi:hypothetical protein